MSASEAERELKIRFHLAELEPHLLRLLDLKGRLTVEEFLATYAQWSEATVERAKTPEQAEKYRSHLAELAPHIPLWMEHARRSRWIEGGIGLDINGNPTLGPEWWLTDTGKDKLKQIEDSQSVIPRGVKDRLIDTAADGLLVAVKAAIAAVPVFILGWAVGVINQPDPIGIALLVAIGAVAIGAARFRWRSVTRARQPRRVAVEAEGNRFIERLEKENAERQAELSAIEAEAERTQAELKLWVEQSEREHAELMKEHAEFMTAHGFAAETSEADDGHDKPPESTR